MGLVCLAPPSPLRARYVRRRPEKSALYEIVRLHMNTLFAEAEARSEYGFGYPAHVKREFERLLTCGQFCCGFARLRCACGKELLVPFSCKAKAVCPSCVGRRMAETAAFLVDQVLPVARWRQWTLSFPIQIRLLLVREPKQLSKVVTTFLRAVFAWQRRQARKIGIRDPQCGSVSLLQRFGSLLQLTPHTHSWIPDGVFYTAADGTMQFQWLPPPKPQEVARLLDKIRRRVLKVCAIELAQPDDDQLALVHAQSEAIEPALRPDRQNQVRSNPLALSGYISGFSLHAGLSVGANKREKLERLLRYGMRPAIATRRLSITADGKVRLKLRKPYFTGQTDVFFEPLAFLRRLAAIVPPPRQNQIRFHGVLAPHSKHNAAVKALVPAAPPNLAQAKPTGNARLDQGLDEAGTPPSRPGYRLLWAQLLKRTFKIDVLKCDRCGGRLKLIALINDPAAIDKICRHLGHPRQLPTVADARPPPQAHFDDLH
jgi:hypothetical protein